MKNLFVGNMSFNTTESELRSIFEPYGEITRIQVMTDRDTGRPEASVSWNWPMTVKRPRQLRS